MCIGFQSSERSGKLPKLGNERTYPYLWRTIIIIILSFLFTSATYLFSADTTWVIRVRLDQQRNPGMILKIFTGYEVVKDTPGNVVIKCMAIKLDSTGKAMADTSYSKTDYNPRLAEIRFSTNKNFLPVDFKAMKFFLVDGKITKKRPVAVRRVP